jgi:hypothetical protein
MPNLKATIDVRSLKSALASLARVAPNRYLPHVRLDVDEHDTATLSVAVSGARLRVPVRSTRADVAGSILLPTDRLGSILRLTKGETADVELLEGPIVQIRTSEPRSGLSATYNLATVDSSAEESTGPVFADDASLWVVPCDDLLRAIERVKHAIGDSTRYSLGGALIEVPSYGRAMALVATDTRRLARQEFRAILSGSGDLPFGHHEEDGSAYRPILPESAFKTLIGLIKSHGGPDIALSFARSGSRHWARFQLGDAAGPELIIRLGEGKFPAWRDALPDRDSYESFAQVNRADLDRAVKLVKVATTPDAPGIRIESIGSGFGAFRLSSGESSTDCYVDGLSGEFGMTWDASYVLDLLKALGKPVDRLSVRATSALQENGGPRPAILETDDGFLGLISPISAPKAKPAPVTKPAPDPLSVAPDAYLAPEPLDLLPGDVALHNPSALRPPVEWQIVRAHESVPGVYWAQRRYTWGLGQEITINPVGAEWSLQVGSDDDESDHAPIASDPAPVVGNPALQAILDTPVPRPRRADLRREPRKEWAREVRKLLKSLGLSGISVRALRYSQASSIDVTLPGQVTHDLSPMRGHDFASCPLCRQLAKAERHIERLIVGAFPDLDDRSDYRDDHYDAPLSIHTGSPIPVASDPEPLPVAYPGIGYPAPAVIYPLQPIILLDDPEPISPDPEPEPLPVSSVRGIPITYGRAVPRVAPVPMVRERNGITLREPEPIGHPCNVTVADAGAPAIGLLAYVVECHGHTEPLSVLDTGAAPVASWPILDAIRELSDVAPSDPAPSPDPKPLAAPDPSRSGRRVGLTFAESIDHEADRLEARRNGAGRLMARALRELAESVRWSGATTPDEHESRMQLWEEWAVDNEPREAMVGY